LIGDDNEKVESVTEVNITDYSDYKFKYFTNLKVEADIDDLAVLFRAICVKACPIKGEVPICKPTSQISKCPMNQMYDTEAFYFICLPEKDDAKDAFEKVYKAINK